MGSQKGMQKWSENGHASKTPLDPGGLLKQENRQLKADIQTVQTVQTAQKRNKIYNFRQHHTLRLLITENGLRREPGVSMLTNLLVNKSKKIS